MLQPAILITNDLFFNMKTIEVVKAEQTREKGPKKMSAGFMHWPCCTPGNLQAKTNTS
jgi:hypothetical protein